MSTSPGGTVLLVTIEKQYYEISTVFNRCYTDNWMGAWRFRLQCRINYSHFAGTGNRITPAWFYKNREGGITHLPPGINSAFTAHSSMVLQSHT